MPVLYSFFNKSICYFYCYSQVDVHSFKEKVIQKPVNLKGYNNKQPFEILNLFQIEKTNEKLVYFYSTNTPMIKSDGSLYTIECDFTVVFNSKIIRKEHRDLDWLVEYRIVDRIYNHFGYKNKITLLSD